ncbi:MULTISPECIES: hypothetical protein [Bacillus amyloliquefaciens group]|uniref:hypothetical protein n=1 Tax=Bacillus amyloliquefaciens group TaxID=1938374 RepID=UPI000A4C862D|nr:MULTISPECIES: hypothetical protein [Bacillus amyloliquefaciens group]MCE4146324.1 hypothetical protein [Bacillus velezensis]
MEFCFTELRDCFLPQTDTICGQILIDEEKHIEFQAKTMRKFCRRRLKSTNTCAVLPALFY